MRLPTAILFIALSSTISTSAALSLLFFKEGYEIVCRRERLSLAPPVSYSSESVDSEVTTCISLTNASPNYPSSLYSSKISLSSASYLKSINLSYFDLSVFLLESCSKNEKFKSLLSGIMQSRICIV